MQCAQTASWVKGMHQGMLARYRVERPRIAAALPQGSKPPVSTLTKDPEYKTAHGLCKGLAKGRKHIT
jgi:hypothetical protein